MSQDNERQLAKAKMRAGVNPAAAILARSLCKILKQKADPKDKNSKSWADKLNTNLVVIASAKANSLALQAMRMVLQPMGFATPEVAGGDEEPTVSKAALRNKSDEEIEARFQELTARLGSVPTAKA